MTTDSTILTRRKLQHLFAIYDFDGNGFLDRNDYEQVVSSLATIRRLKPETPGYQSLSQAYLGVWEELRSEADANNDGRVTLNKMLDFWRRMGEDPKLFYRHVVALGDLLFILLDANGDGYIVEQEYLDYARCLGFEAGQEAFTKLDVNRTGRLTRDDLRQRLQEFYLSESESAAGNWFFGQLPSPESSL